MKVTLILFAGAAALELLAHLFGRWRRPRSILAVLALCTGGISAGMLAAVQPNVFTVVIALLSVYRMFNMIRVVWQRMHEHYLRNATRTTTFSLLGMQVAAFAAWAAWQQWYAGGSLVWSVAGVVQAAAALMLVMSVRRTLTKSAWPPEKKHYSDRELPTVTVAIPARNETDDLRECLENIIASDYPKLEVVVLDDCSQTKRTPEIIKQFAHDGVRFVQGRPPEDTWLPKNQAYARLTEEASGEYILFCGVDIRLEPPAIRKMISTMLARHKQMLCVLPRRQTGAYGHTSLIQAMRYWWELAPPRRSFRRPPVLSSCWVIQRGLLKKAGGFAAVARSITPEAHFAKAAIQTDGYSFLRATHTPGVFSNKRVAEQRDTAIRTRYPQLHKRPEQVALLSLLEIGFLLMPFVLTLAGFWVAIGSVAHITAAVASILLVIAYEASVLTAGVNTWWFGLAGQPLAVLTDLVLLHFSMWKYEFSIVEWKGRNVCIPVMHVVPHLPKVE